MKALCSASAAPELWRARVGGERGVREHDLQEQFKEYFAVLIFSEFDML